MRIKTGSSLAAYLTGAAALAGASAHGAIVYQSFNTALADTSNAGTTPNAVLAAIHFDGTSILLDHATSGASLSISADDVTTIINPDNTYYKSTIEGTVAATGGYSQTSSFLNAGQLIATGFTAASGPFTLSGAATDQIIGVSTTAGNLGWVRFSYTADGATVTVRDAAFESTPGQSITAGAVPETSAVALLGLAGGLAALRRKRR